MLFCKTIGKKENPHLVMLHGFLGCYADFSLMAKHLKEDYLLHLIDLPGHGRSDFSSQPFQDIQEAITHATHSEPYALLGYSMGGRIASYLAEKDVQALSLILLASHPGLKTEEEKQNRLSSDLAWCKLLEEGPIEEFLQKWYDQSLFFSLRRKKKVFESMMNRRECNFPLLLSSALKYFSLSHDNFKETYPKPTLALYGQYDKTYRELYTKLPETVKVVSISDSGHALHLENPSFCAKIIKSFLKELVCSNLNG